MNFFLVFLKFCFVYCLKFEKNIVPTAFDNIAQWLIKSNRVVTVMNFADDEGVFDVVLKNFKHNNVPFKLKTKYLNHLTEYPVEIRVIF
jgi:hypothetical protein